MELSKQVCNYQQGKRLVELGVTERPVFMCCLFTSGSSLITNTDTGVHLGAAKHAPAWTVAELGVMLPERWDSNGVECCWVSSNEIKESGGGFICTQLDLRRINTRHFSAPNEAEARALMLIELLENGAVTAEEVNQRLSQ